jgi:serine O-acetyltransferase
MSKFSEDLARYRAKGYKRKDLWLEPAIWSIAAHRFGNWLYVDPPPAILRFPLKFLSFLLSKFCLIFMEMDIDAQATIGGGLHISHIGGVHINEGAVLGKNCNLTHHITIGASAMGRSGIPVIGDDVYIGTGAVLVGKIRVGSGAKIAANTLVMTNVPEGATVMGVPGRIVMRPQSPRASITTRDSAGEVRTLDAQ